MSSRHFARLFLGTLLVSLWALPAQAAVTRDQLEDYLKQMNVAYAAAPEENGYIVSYEGKNARQVTVFIINDEAKNVLECYAYADLKLQNIRHASDQAAVMARLLKLNHKAFGTFFIDDDGDIGVRFTFTTENGVGFESFKVAVETLRRVADNAAPTITKLLALNHSGY